jgi:hypothetical protein
MLIWSYKKITELKGATGFIDCEKTLAEKLLADGHVQNPAVGSNHLKQIEKTEISSAYADEKPKKKTTKARSVDSEGDL